MQLAVQVRTTYKKGVKDLRKSGLVPGVVYGRHLETPLSISFDKVLLLKAIHKAGKSTPVELKGDGVDQLVLFHDVQLDPVRDSVIHVDCLAVNKDETVHAEVPIILIGESSFEKSNLGRVQLLKDTLAVEALPLDLPHDIQIDVSELTEAGQVLHVSDLKVSDKVTILDDMELAVVSTVEFKEEVEEEEDAVVAEGEESEGETEEKSE